MTSKVDNPVACSVHYLIHAHPLLPSGCKLTHYRDGNECQPCANNSMSASFDATFCTCNGNLVTQDGSNDTQDSSDNCDCK